MINLLSFFKLVPVLKLVIDLETNSLSNPTQIWCAVCRDIDTGDTHIFRRVTQNEDTKRQLVDLLTRCTVLIGHNLCGYDLPVCHSLLPDTRTISCTTYDTLIISKLVDYSRPGHSVEDYGREFGLEKGKFNDFSKYSPEMEQYCIRDVDITERIYRKYLRYINNVERARSIRLEHDFQLVCNKLEKDGFAFNKEKANVLLNKVNHELSVLDEAILSSFPPRLKLIREVLPKETKHGTISLTSIPAALRESIADFTVGAPFSYCSWTEFNPSSHKQIIGVLNDAGWKPTDRTTTHINTERELNKLKHTRGRSKELDLRKEALHTKLNELNVSGWKVNETNLDTLPSKAPASARTLAKRILLESRRRTLTEWLDLVSPAQRIHGRFYGIGAWTHRMAHQNPNTANIPNETDQKGQKKLYGKELRSLWIAPKNRLLVGCDAEGIQLRIFAHYIDDKEFTHELLNGDPHSLNQSILNAKTRDAAKRYIYALLLGAGAGKLREILDCDEGTAGQAYERLLTRYTGFQHLKEKVIPADAKRGWFVGLDGRAVRIPGDTVGARRHLAMSGYLQNGEAVVMKMATMKWWPKLPSMDAMLVDMVHDEWQTECPNNIEIALRIAKMQADSLREVGEELKLRCPLAGSYWSKKYKDYTIDTNWSKTH
jgi:DNA polymerase I